MARAMLWFALLVTFLCGCNAKADTISIVSEAQPVLIPYGQTHKFQFGTVSQANTVVLLKIKSRMDLGSLLGSLQFLRLTLNGHDVQPAKSRFAQRLRNKPLSSPVTPSLTVPWFVAGSWNVLYAPDFKAAYSQSYYVGDPYTYVLDVTDLVNPVAENRLEIHNTANLDFISSNHFPNNKLDLVVGALEIETQPGQSPMMEAAESAAPVINRGEPGAGPAAYRGELAPGGGFIVRMGEKAYRFNSRFSFPDAGFNRLAAGPADSGGQKAWKVKTEKNKAVAEGGDYKVVRTVNFGARRIEIADTITNRGAEPLGLSVRHELDMGDLKNTPVRLAGNPDPALTEYNSYGNPSLHVTVPGGALGIIAEDDVFRSQVKLYTRNDEAAGAMVGGIRTDMLRLAAGETYTLHWAVYPVSGPDYYDFVNLVRADWGANYTAWGTWIWGFPELAKLSLEEIRARIQHQGIRYYIASDWVEWSPSAKGTQRIAFGSDVFSDYWAARRDEDKQIVQKLKQAVPSLKAVGYFNSIRESRDDAAGVFKDSLQTDESGAPIMTQWAYTGATNRSYSMVPTLRNSHGKAMLETARRYMDDMKLDGIYWDETENTSFGSIPISYNNFDGHSCLLDEKTWRIKREIGITTLSSRSFYNEVAHIVQGKGGAMLCNGPTASRDTLRDRVQRMVEVQHNDYYAFEGNLQSPLGYMGSRTTWDDYLRALRMAILPAVGMSNTLTHDLTAYLFPFTPIELHSGYLLGQERIIAEHSGNYGWKNDSSLVQVHRFDSSGKVTAADLTTLVGGEARTRVELKPGEAVVLERLPLALRPLSASKSWQAEISGVVYGEKSIALKLKAPEAGLLQVSNGTFKIQDGGFYKVQCGSAAGRLARAEGKTLRVKLPARFNDRVVISKVVK